MVRHAAYQDKRGRIIDAALRVLAAEGYPALTVDRAIAEAGISKGTFYHYFEAKEELVEAMLLGAAERVVDAVTASARTVNGPVERLSALLTVVRPWTGDEPADGRAVAAVLRNAPELAGLRPRVFAALADRLTPELTAVLNDGVRAGEFHVEDPATTAALLVLLALSTRARVAELVLDQEGPMARIHTGSVSDAECWITAFFAIVQRTLALPPARLLRCAHHGGVT